ncbi:MAG TPA: hypothetical protein VFJ85_04585 [Acidimicrobiales bacterium]|nr:hypothetical protein [Acidimicrobiales bacterium]
MQKFHSARLGERGRRTVRRAGAFAAVAVLAAGAGALPAGAKGAPSGGGTSGSFSCRASVVRVTGAGLLSGTDVDLNTANPAGTPCADASAGLLNQQVSVDGGTTLQLRADLLVSTTDGPGQGYAHAGVANLSLDVLGLHIAADVLSAEATAGPCPGTGLASESVVARVNVTDSLGVTTTVDVPAGQQHVEVSLTALGLGVLQLHLNETTTTGSQVTQRALWLHSDLIGDVVVGEAMAGVQGSPCGGYTPPRNPKRFMTGGGSVDSAVGRVTHGAHLQCGAADGPSNLQVNWGGNRFHLDAVSTASCSDDPAISPGQPAASFDTLTGTGTGSCNGVAGVQVAWKLTDAGEPGRADRFEFRIVNAGTSGCSLNAAGTLAEGNHQAHQAT